MRAKAEIDRFALTSVRHKPVINHVIAERPLAAVVDALRGQVPLHVANALTDASKPLWPE
jgi:hypothetical protein